MKTTYSRLTLRDREEISRTLARGESFGNIARRINRPVSTISREVNKAGMNRYTYRAERAHRRSVRNARKRKRGKRKAILQPRLRHYIHQKLRLLWSPEQIARELIREYPKDDIMRVSREAIYAYLYVLPKGELRKELLSCLRQKRKRRRKRGHKNQQGIERKIADMISIEERPAEVARRTVPGHWEGDILLGKYRKSAMGTLVERTTRAVIIVPLPNKHSEVVARAFAREAKRLPRQMRLSLTYDQGREMAAHKLFAKNAEMKVFFCHPRSPWERGTGENTNGLVRQFFPKGTDFTKVSRREIKRAQHLLNGRPRKVLGWRKPYEAFNELVALNS
jgi:IS30 family transposase